MNSEIKTKFNQQRFLLQKLIDKITTMQERIVQLETKVNENDSIIDTNNNHLSETVISILANYDSRIEDLEQKIDQETEKNSDIEQ
tara:strand:- start:2719 stop:2976 length:258 start_codon:yes stop_codon:yes gene_type:complete